MAACFQTLHAPCPRLHPCSQWAGRDLVPPSKLLRLLRHALQQQGAAPPPSVLHVLAGDLPFKLWVGPGGLPSFCYGSACWAC